MANTQNLDLVKPLGTDHALVSVLNSNSDKIDAYAGAVNASLDGLRDGLGVLADGNTHAAITSGQFVYVKNHQTLPQGLYQATTNIAANGTLSTSNLTADPKGGLNTLSEHIANFESADNFTLTAGDGTTTLTAQRAVLKNGVVQINGYFVRDSSFAIRDIIFTIPSGYRPPVDIRGFVFSTNNDIWANVNVRASGVVQIDSTLSGAVGKYMMFDFVYPI